MRSSRVLQTSAKGYGWYNHFKQHGAAGFKKSQPPAAFNWENSDVVRPKAFFDLAIGGEKAGRMVFELASDIVPKTVENFKLLCTGAGPSGKSYKGTKFHLVNKDKFLMGGDVETAEGFSSHSAYNTRYIKDENFIISHGTKGIISMASVGVDTNGSQFYITLGSSNHLNGRCTGFGRIVEGEHVLDPIQKIFSFRLAPSTDITITDCGLL